MTEFCLLQGKHGGFELERSDTVFVDALPFQEFPFGDMPDAGPGPSALDWPLGVLKQGIASRVGCGELTGYFSTVLQEVRWPLGAMSPQ